MIFDVHAHCGTWFFPTFCETPEQMSGICDRFGVEKVVVSSSRALTYDMVTGNAEALDFVKQDPRFFAYLYLNPNDLQGSRAQIDRYLEMDKFVGIKLHPSYTGLKADSEETLGLLDYLPHGAILLIHTWGEDGVGRVHHLAEKFPNFDVIMGHMGGTSRSGWMAAIDSASRIENVYLEICGSLLHYDRIKIAVGSAGAEKVLFGSDMSLLNPSFALGQIIGSSISEGDKKMILRNNAVRLFGFED